MFIGFFKILVLIKFYQISLLITLMQETCSSKYQIQSIIFLFARSRQLFFQRTAECHHQVSLYPRSKNEPGLPYLRQH